MKFIAKIIGPNLAKPASDRAKTARMTELANALKVVADSIANCGSKDGQIKNGDFNGSFFIED
jgi:hypothetical protein